jgi:hypothetical protein
MKIYSHLPQLVATLCLSGLCLTGQAETETFTVHNLLDTNGTKHVALTYLLPKGWKTDDQLQWLLNIRTAPMQFSITASSSDGRFTVFFHNSATGNYTRGPRGGRGMIPPDHPSDLIIDSFMKAHPGVGQIQVVDQQDTPTKSNFRPSGVITCGAFMCSAKLRYSVNGVPMMAKLGFRFDGFETATQWERSRGSAFGTWYAGKQTIVVGPEAEFSKADDVAAVMISSIRFDPEFFQQYMEITQMENRLITQEGQVALDVIRKQGEALEAMRNSYHPISAFNKDEFEHEMAEKDRHTRDVCDYILDRGRFTNGTTDFLVPKGYNYAGEKNGDIVLSNDPDFNRLNGYQDLKKLGPGSN